MGVVPGQGPVTGDSPVLPCREVKARRGRVAACFPAYAVDGPVSGDRRHLLPEAVTAGRGEVCNERGVHDAEDRVSGCTSGEGGQEVGGISGVNRYLWMLCCGAERLVEVAGTGWVVGTDQGAEPGGVVRVERAERAEVDAGPPGDGRGRQPQRRRYLAAQFAGECER